MAGADKILVVVILIFSCVFLYTAVSVFGSGQKERKDKEQLLDQIDEKESKIKSLETREKAGTEFDLKKAMKGLTDVKEALDVVNESNVKIVERMIELSKSVDGRMNNLKTGVKALEGYIATLNESIVPALTEQLDGINEKILNQAKKISNLEDKNRELANAFEMEKEKHREELKKRDKKITVLEAKLRGEEKGPELGTPLPDVVCNVLNVVRDRDSSMVLLDKGTEHGLFTGLELFVYNRVERYKGIIKVYKMEGKDRCIATIVREADGKKIAENDKAAVKTWKAGD